MALVECASGHLYNTDQYASCPYCGGTLNRVEFGSGSSNSSIGKTAPVGYEGAGYGYGSQPANGGTGGNSYGATAAPMGYGATTAPSGYGGNSSTSGYGATTAPSGYGGSSSQPGYGATTAPSGYGGSSSQSGYGADREIGATVAPSSYKDSQKNDGTDQGDPGKTVGVLKKSLNIEPVVGWIVCIEGADKGKDFHIMARNNSIGRSERMDICIKGDATISRENHARIAFDVKHNVCHLIPAESTNGIYLNGDPVYVPTELKHSDVIELGESKFMFIPLCNENFSWQS